MGVDAYLCVNKGDIRVDVSDHSATFAAEEYSYYAAGMAASGIASTEKVEDCVNFGNIECRDDVVFERSAYYRQEENATPIRKSYAAVNGLARDANRCVNYGDVTAIGETANCSGVCEGYNRTSKCMNFGNVAAHAYSVANAAGIVANGTANCQDCANTGDVLATSSYKSGAGGISAQDSTDGLENCYSTGNVSSEIIEPLNDDTYAYADPVSAAQIWWGQASDEDWVSCYYLDSAVITADLQADRSSHARTDGDLRNENTFTGWDFDNDWYLPKDQSSYPKLRFAFNYLSENASEPDKDDGAMLADAALTQLAACALTEFQIGNGFEGSTVSDFLDSPAFADEKIWDGLDNTYGDFFASTIGGYEIVRARLYGDSPYIALKNPDTGDVIFAVASVTANGTSLDITSTEVQRYFDEVASNLAEVESAEPNATIYLTGSGTGGQAAAYASSATGMEATTFNAAPGFGARLALITQAPLLTGNEFRGVGDSACVNYYNASRENAYSYGKDILPSMAVSNNSAGSEYQLNGLYRYKDGAYEMQPVVQNTIENRMLELSVANVDDIAESIARTAHSAFQNGSAEIDLSFEEIGEDYAQVVLGTSGMDKFVPGDPFRGELFNWFKKQVCYTGAGDGDFFKGGTTSDVFVAGEGESQLIGGEGADVYVVGDNASVEISDTGAKDGNQMIDGAFGVLKMIVSQGADGGADALEAIAKLLLDTDQDTVVLKNCGFDDMKVALVKGSAPFGWDDHYVITAGASTVEIPAGRADDFAVVDSSARTMTVEQLCGGSERNAIYAATRDAATGSSGEGGYVTLDMMGNDLKVEIVDVSTGEVLDTLDSTESMDLYMDNCAFSSFPEVGLITGAYDSSKIKVQMIGGDFKRVIANKNVDDVKSALIYADGFAVGQNEAVEIAAEDLVSFVKVSPDGERAEMEIGEVTNAAVSGDEDEPDVPGTPEEPADPSVPSQPSRPSGDFSGEAHASKVEFDVGKGSVTVSPESAKAGEDVTVTAKPLFGFEISSVAVVSGGESVEATQSADGVWTFEMPNAEASISVEFVPVAWDNPFADVEQGEWYFDSVRRANLAGLMKGYAGTALFGPNDGLIREQAATVMWNLMGRGVEDAPAAPHGDVDQTQWYAPYVNWTVDSKVMDGYSSEDFGVGDALTREQFAAVIAKAIGADVDAAGQGSLGAFTDADSVSDWAKPTMAWAVETGVINGVEHEDGSRSLDAARTLTRAEMATMVMNAVDKGVLRLKE